jgi:hypothetical protein
VTDSDVADVLSFYHDLCAAGQPITAQPIGAVVKSDKIAYGEILLDEPVYRNIRNRLPIITVGSSAPRKR